MRAVGQKVAGPLDAPDALVDFEAPEPEPGPSDLLVAVKAISVNPVDYKVRSKTPPPGGGARILGWDAAGVVLEAGPETEGFKPGDRVFYAGDLERPGSNAERQAVDWRIVGRAPETLDFADAAALPLTAITAWEMLFDRLGVAEGDGGTLLMIGAGGGVGSIATQIARALTDLTVIATAGRPETVDWLRALGAHHVIDHAQPLAAQARAIAPDGVDMAFAINGTEEHFAEIVEALRPQGRFGLIDDPAALDVKALKRKSLSLHWEFMFTRPMFACPDMAAQGALLNRVAALVDAGAIRSTRAETLGRMSAETLLRAHGALERREARGKLVLEVG